MKMSFLSPKENLRGKTSIHIYVTSLIFVKRLRGRDFLKKLNNRHKSPTDTLTNKKGKLMISTEIIYNKGRKHSGSIDRYISKQSGKN